jgi:hypothetical protein
MYLLSSIFFSSSQLALALYSRPSIVAVIQARVAKKGKCLVLKHISVPRHALLEVDNSVVGIGHWPLVDPGVDVLVSGELQHLPDLVGGADEGAADLDLLEDEGEGHEPQGVLGGADLDELTADVEQAEIAVHGDTGARDGADDQVE